MVYSPVPKGCDHPPCSDFGPHNVFIDARSDLPWHFHRNYSSSHRYSHFYGGFWRFPYSNYPLHALYRSPWLNRPYHNMGTAMDWYY